MKAWPLLLVLLAGCGCVSYPSHDALRNTALRLMMKHDDGRIGVCSGTTTGPNTFRTAKHCVANIVALTINGEDADPESVKYTGADVADVTLKAPRFKVWAKPGPLPKQGDRLRFFGNPKGIADVYREGIVANVGDVIAVDATVCKGDSGAGLFNERGELVGVVVQMLPEQIGCAFTVGQP